MAHPHMRTIQLGGEGGGGGELRTWSADAFELLSKLLVSP